MGKLTKNIFLIGFMGVGKTTVARRLARDLRVSAVDVDSFIQRKHGQDASELFEARGEEAFRAMEAQALRECVGMGPAIISCSEGIVTSPTSRAILAEQGLTVLLESSAEESLERIRSLRTRPLLAQGCDADSLWSERKPLYDEVAHVTVDVASKNTPATADAIERLLIEMRAYIPDETDGSNE